MLTREVSHGLALAWGKSFLIRFLSMNLLKRFRAAFTEHPSAVGETYLQHVRHSFQFGFAMACGSAAAFIHAVAPALCTSTGSRIITRLHDLMILNRMRLRATAQGNSAGESYLAEHI